MALPLAVAMVAMNAANAFSQASTARSVARARDRVANAESDINRRIQMGANALEAATTNFERAMQGAGNRRLLEEGGRAIAVELQNAAREADFASGAAFEQSIQGAEQQGAQVAAAAFAGVGGSTVDAITTATSLRRARAADTAKTYAGYQQYDSAARRMQLAEQVVGGLDQSILLETFDLSPARPPQFAQTQNPLMAGLLAGLNTATQFSGAFRTGTAASASNIPSSALIPEPTDF